MLSKIITRLTLSILILLPLRPIHTKIPVLKIEEPLPDHFDKVYNAFQSYNNDTDTSLVITFCKVAQSYGLSDDVVEFEWLMGQVLLESGAQQYNDGKLVVSNTGAVGFGQILRSTCLAYMRRSLNKNDSLIFRRLGVTDYSFAYDETCSRGESWRMAKKWLSNDTNNIAMWGKIMSDELKRRSLMKALVSYNIGPGGMRAYLDSGHTLVRHHYIVGIRSRLKYIR
jgi:hypothetical protein